MAMVTVTEALVLAKTRAATYDSFSQCIDGATAQVQRQLLVLITQSVVRLLCKVRPRSVQRLSGLNEAHTADPSARWQLLIINIQRTCESKTSPLLPCRPGTMHCGNHSRCITRICCRKNCNCRGFLLLLRALGALQSARREESQSLGPRHQ